jgi:hypothetical protein
VIPEQDLSQKYFLGERLPFDEKLFKDAKD